MGNISSEIEMSANIYYVLKKKKEHNLKDISFFNEFTIYKCNFKTQVKYS